MFNLDKLDEGHPEWLCRNAWDVGQVPEATNSFVQSMVPQWTLLTIDRLRIEISNSSSGLSIRRTS